MDRPWRAVDDRDDAPSSFAFDQWRAVSLPGFSSGTGSWAPGSAHPVTVNSTWSRIKAVFAGNSAPGNQMDPPLEPVVTVDPVVALQERLRDIVRSANRHGGRLPDGAVPAVHEIEDVLRPLLVHVAKRGAGVEAMHDLEAIVQDYLPGALDRYLDLPADYALGNRGPSGTTPAVELVAQLKLLAAGSRDLYRAVYDHDAQQLATQGRFLDAKFRHSDLEL